MDLYAEILVNALRYGKIEVTFPGGANLNDIIERTCYTALRDITEIIRNPELDDPECFRKIEAIVETLESAGISGGPRHDFG